MRPYNIIMTAILIFPWSLLIPTVVVPLYRRLARGRPA